MFPDLKNPNWFFGFFFFSGTYLPINTNMVGMICQHILFGRADLKNTQKINWGVIITGLLFHFGVFQFLWCSHLFEQNHGKPEWFGKGFKTQNLIPTLWDGERHFSQHQERKNRPEREKKIRIFQVQHTHFTHFNSEDFTKLYSNISLLFLHFRYFVLFLFSSKGYINSAKI